MVEDSALRLLVLLRHAKALPSAEEGDVGRRLTEDGLAEAVQVGTWLLSEGVRPDVVLCSPSARTLQTWDGLREAGLKAPDLWTDAALYDADVDDLLESIRAVPDEVGTLVVVGHAPGVPALAATLADHLPENAAQLAQGWPPAAAAVVGHPGRWAQFPAPDTALVAFRRP